MTSVSEKFLKIKDIVDLVKVNFGSELFIQSNAEPCFEPATGGVHIYLYVCISVSIYWSLSLLCMRICVYYNANHLWVDKNWHPSFF